MDLAEIKKLIAQTRISVRQVLGLENRLSALEAGGGGDGTSDHALLTHKDYASAGHTGFVGTSDSRLSDARIPTSHGNDKHSSTFITAGDIPTIPNELSDLTDDATHRLVTDTEKSAWNGKQDALGFTPLNSTAFSGLAKITVAASAPGSAGIGDLWINTA